MKIVITGGASIVNNLGDQAMLFTLIEYLKKHNPKNDIVLFDEEAYFNDNLRKKFTFRILPDIPMSQKLKHINRVLHYLYKLFNPKNKFSKKLELEIVNEYRSCDYIFQIAGFGISSQMSYKNVISRIWDISLAKRLGKKIILMPQSLGPFDFTGVKKILFENYLRRYINYPEYVLCRETAGKELLEKNGCHKAEIEHDLVLARPDDLDSSFIFSGEKENPPVYDIDKQKDMVIIPNFRFLKYRSENEICDIYEKIINGCLGISRGSVYLFNHVKNDDGVITKAIYKRFENNPDVFMIDGGFDCMDAEKFFSKFAVGIAARWHANVHIIRAGLPYVVIGWAEKYHETARLFNNEEVVFDIREHLMEKNIISAIERVYINRNEISRQIIDKEAEIKKTFCLDRIMKNI